LLKKHSMCKKVHKITISCLPGEISLKQVFEIKNGKFLNEKN
jgi:hypothetical protein